MPWRQLALLQLVTATAVVALVGVVETAFGGRFAWVHCGVVGLLLGGVGSLVWLLRRSRLARSLADRERGWLETVANGEGEGFWIYDPRTKEVEYAGPQLARIWKRDPKVLLQLFEHYAQRPLDENVTELDRVVSEQPVGAPARSFELQTRRSDGSALWVRVTYAKVYDEVGKRELAVGMSRDVTELKRSQAAERDARSNLEEQVEKRTADLVRANAALHEEVETRRRAELAARAASARIRAILEHSLDMYAEVDAAGCVVDASSSLLALMDVQREQLIGASLRSLLDDPEEMVAVYDLLRDESGDARGGTAAIRVPRLGVRQLEWSALTVASERGERRVLVFARDVTERVKAERRFEELFHSAPDAAVAVDSTGRVLLFNQAAEWLFQRRADDVVGESVEILVPERFRYGLKSFPSHPTQRILGPSTPFVARADGSEIPVEVSQAVLGRDENLWVVSSIRDISARLREQEEREQLQAAVRHAQKLESLGVLAGGVAHDFNNLLAAVVNYANLALLRLEPDAGARRDLQQIKAAANRMGELAGLMLAYSGRSATSREPVDLNAELREIYLFLESVISKKASVERSLAPDLPALLADPSQIRQVLVNLIVNASDALGGMPGRIDLRTGRLEDLEALRSGDLHWEGPLLEEGVYLEVADTGCGMDAETRSRMFEPFFTTKQTGRGLGLAAVSGIVRSHGGAIGVQSELGKGTRVVVVLPSAGGVAEAVASRREEDGSLDGVRVLVVDDEFLVRESARRLLEARGATVVACPDGGSTIERLRKSGCEFDAVILDYTMPDLDGGVVLREIRECHQTVPIALCSGYRAPAIGAATEADPNLLRVRKPYDLGDVLTKLLALAADAPAVSIRA